MIQKTGRIEETKQKCRSRLISTQIRAGRKGRGQDDHFMGRVDIVPVGTMTLRSSTVHRFLLLQLFSSSIH